jgi:hypothetical protein
MEILQIGHFSSAQMESPDDADCDEGRLLSN